MKGWYDDGKDAVEEVESDQHSPLSEYGNLRDKVAGEESAKSALEFGLVQKGAWGTATGALGGGGSKPCK